LDLAALVISSEEGKKGFMEYSTENLIIYYTVVAAWSPVVHTFG
jgi:hypothetical protein